jgi:hypothetical protein
MYRDPLQMGDNHKNVKMGWGKIKNYLKNYWAKIAEIYVKAL